MKTTKERTRIKLSKRAAPARKNSRKPVEITMEEVGKGHYLGMKYLFEMIGLYPATGEEGTLVPDSMAAVLMRRLGLPENAAPEQIVTKDQETAAAVWDEEGLK